MKGVGFAWYLSNGKRKMAVLGLKRYKLGKMTFIVDLNPMH